MGENSNAKVQNDKAPKTSFFKGLKAEFKKIIWPKKGELVRESVVVVISIIVLGLLIAGIDMLIQYGVNFLINL